MFELFQASARRPAHPPEPFLVLPENQFAHAALGRLLQESLPHRHEALLTFVHGPAGVGKSHLLRQALRDARRRRPKLRVLQTTADEFAAQAALAAESQLAAEFHERCAELDLLLCEDLHSLEEQPELLPAFTSAIETIQQADARIVLTSRKTPGELAHFPARLMNRCQGGLCAAIRRPGPESRQLLIQHFAASRQLALMSDVVALLVAEGPTSPAELQTVVWQLEAASRQRHTAVTVDLARHVIGQRRLDLAAISEAVAQEFGLTQDDLRSRSRSQSLMLPRQVAMWLARELAGERLERIGAYYGGRSHTAVAHGCRRLAELLPNAPSLRQQVARIRTRLTEFRAVS